MELTESGICNKCNHSPIKITKLENGWYCFGCIKAMAIAFLKKDFTNQKIIMEAQKIINEKKK